MAENELYYSETGIITGSNNVYGDLTIPNKIPHSPTTQVTKIGYEAFRDCKELTSVIIPDSVTEIGEFAFYGCSGLTSVVIPDSVTEIGEAAFEDCTGLTSVVIPESLIHINAGTFYGCSGLTSAVIPDSVTEIWMGAFFGCTCLTSVKSEIREPSECEHAFDDAVMATATLYVPAGTASKYRATEGWKGFANIVEDSDL